MSVSSKRTKNEQGWSAKYPKAFRDNLVADFYHDIRVDDPYRWLEDPHTVDTRDYVVQQNEITSKYLEDYENREYLTDKVKGLLCLPTKSVPVRNGTKYFQKRNNGKQNQDVLYYTDRLDKEGFVFLDPNRISTDGSTSIKCFSFSPNSDYMAYGISISESEWIMVKIRNTRTGEDLAETLYKIRSSKLVWDKSNTGFFYSGYLEEKDITYFGINTKTNRNQKIYFHKLEEDQDNDVLVCGFDNPDIMLQIELSNCGSYLIVYGFKNCRSNSVHISFLEPPNYTSIDLHPLIHNFENSYTYVTNIKNKMIMQTDNGAANYRLIGFKFNINKNEEMTLTNVIPEHKDYVLKWAKAINHNHIVVCYLIKAKDQLSIFTSDGLKMMDLNILEGTITEISGEANHEEMFVSITNFCTPNAIFRIDLSELTPSVKRIYKTNIPVEFKELIVSEQLYYNSSDNTEIPFCLYKRRDLVKREERPCILCTYDEFCSALTPRYNAALLLFIMHFHGICVFANIRGGSEFGKNWQNMGSRKYKFNAVNDLNYCAKYLIEHNYTNAFLLTVLGRTDGATIAAIAMNQFFNLFNTAVLFSGVYDILRYPNFTCAHAWVSEFGNPDKKEEFNNIMKFSPLHNVDIAKAATAEYPACFFLTSDHDDFVVPSHSLKFVATLQNSVGLLPHQTKPILMKLDAKSGHGIKKPQFKKIEEIVDVLVFIAKTLRLQLYDYELANKPGSCLKK